MEVRWRGRLLVPLVLAAACGGVLAALPAGGQTASPGALLPVATPVADCFAPATAQAADPARSPWFTVRPREDSRGALMGHVLRLAGRGALAGIELPPESFGAGPFGESVLVGADDGRASTVRLVSPASGCDRVLIHSDQLVRRATIDRARRLLITFRLDRAQRTDQGVWAAPLDAPDTAQVLLPPLPMSDDDLARFGPTFATDLLWSQNGERLVVQSCGEWQCRFRIVEPASGQTWTLAGDGLGDAIGLDGDHLVTSAACGGMPCPVVRTDIATGEQVELVEAAGPATMTRLRGDPVVAADLVDGLAIVDLATGAARTLMLPATIPGLRLAVGGGSGGLGLPPGWIGLAAEGRLPEPLRGGRAFAFDLDSTRLVSLLGGA